LGCLEKRVTRYSTELCLVGFREDFEKWVEREQQLKEVNSTLADMKLDGVLNKLGSPAMLKKLSAPLSKKMKKVGRLMRSLFKRLFKRRNRMTCSKVKADGMLTISGKLQRKLMSTMEEVDCNGWV
jgi:hypothetical protein